MLGFDEDNLVEGLGSIDALNSRQRDAIEKMRLGAADLDDVLCVFDDVEEHKERKPSTHGY